MKRPVYVCHIEYEIAELLAYASKFYKSNTANTRLILDTFKITLKWTMPNNVTLLNYA